MWYYVGIMLNLIWESKGDLVPLVSENVLFSCNFFNHAIWICNWITGVIDHDTMGKAWFNDLFIPEIVSSKFYMIGGY